MAPLKTQPRPTSSRVLARLALWGLPAAVIWDFVGFLNQYRVFHEMAQSGLNQIQAPKDSQETIIVLTGDIGRIPRALDLLRARDSSQLIISGAAKGVALSDLVNQQGASTVGLGAIWGKILLESKSSSTVENAKYSKEVLGPRPPSRILLVTSDYHMGRSLNVFREVFPEYEIIPYCVLSTFSGKYGLHFFWKTGAEYWKSLVYRASLFFGVDAVNKGSHAKRSSDLDSLDCCRSSSATLGTLRPWHPRA